MKIILGISNVPTRAFDWLDLTLFADVRPHVYAADSLVVDKHGTDRTELLILSLPTRLPFYRYRVSRRASG